MLWNPFVLRLTRELHQFGRALERGKRPKVGIAEAAAIAHQAAGQRILTIKAHPGQPMAGRQRRELFHPPVEEGAAADQDPTNAVLQKSCEGRFEIAIGSGIHHKELQAQRARRRLQVCDDGSASTGPAGTSPALPIYQPN